MLSTEKHENTDGEHADAKHTKKTYTSKFTSWFKHRASKNAPPTPNLKLVNAESNNSPTKPSLGPIPLKQASSFDEKKRRELERRRKAPHPLLGIDEKEQETANKHKCFTEANQEDLLNEFCESWMKLHDHGCTSQRMEYEASHQCLNHIECVPTKRVYFILSYCEKYVDFESQAAADEEALSSFMSGLPGYSHIQLTKDFRHLQMFHRLEAKPDLEATRDVDFSDTKSLLKFIYSCLTKHEFHLNMNKKHGADDETHCGHHANIQAQRRAARHGQKQKHRDCKQQQTPLPMDSGVRDADVLLEVSKLMMSLKTKKDFNAKYMKLGLISQGANGKIFAIKSWQKREFLAMKEICFKSLNIHILYEILRNWQMVKQLELVGQQTEMFVDSKKSIFIIVLHLYKGSMCELLKDIYTQKERCLNEAEVKMILQNGVLSTLRTMHSNGYIHGDIKPENIVYEYKRSETTTKKPVLRCGIIDYDLCTKLSQTADGTFEAGAFSEWRGTLGYSAPEWSPYQSVKSYIDGKVDIFSLGLTILILLCGEQPFLCPTAVKQQLQKENPTINIKQFVYETMMNNGELMLGHFLKQLAPNIDADLYDLLQSMLAFNPQQRFDIEQVIQHQWFQRETAN
eukprot:CAMPEP_0197076212 /NCGR_PEP_ID=MMETSP1384-20130603/211998_1 /TAXON_ID=29189 /ORGANISM="Ammonia sp." /LENGTH=626 /DNA_ID=CAMNT_0042515065 /DNA_START=161 /DNA_END=2041 /DNA_ORIENTATION=-